MRILALLALCMAACAFDPRGLQPGDGDGGAVDAAADDGTGIDAAEIDAPIDAPTDAPVDAPIDAPVDAPVDAAIDARVCPTAPTGCTAFSCAGSASCYYHCSTTRASWTAANGRCGTTGVGCLVTINDAVENACIATVTAPLFPDLVWFGWRQSAAGSEPAGGWDWACGASTFLAGNWGFGEPNNSGGNEDCGVMGSGGAWIDGDCSDDFRYVCELP